MSGTVDVLRFDEGKETFGILIMEHADGRARHVVDRRLAALISVDLHAHVSEAEQPQHFSSRQRIEIRLRGDGAIALLLKGGDHVDVVRAPTAGLSLR